MNVSLQENQRAFRKFKVVKHGLNSKGAETAGAESGVWRREEKKSNKLISMTIVVTWLSIKLQSGD